MAPYSTLQKLGLICLASSIVPSSSALSVAVSAAQALGVLQLRDSTCANSTFNSCTSIDSNLPSNFCCPPTDTCISLDSSSSALCCPPGANCTVIRPIICSINQQNVALHPGNSVMTTKLDSNLPKCGDQCCPFGYTCDLNGVQCALIIDESSLNPSSSSSASTTTATSTAGTSSLTPFTNPTGSPTAAASNGTGINSNAPPITAQCTRFPGAAVAAGFFPGMLAGALLAFLGVICLGKSRHKSSSIANSPPSKFSSHYRGRSSDGAIIGVSDPIPISQAARTDFLRRQPEMVKRTGTRMKSWFSSKSSPTFLGGESPNTQNHWKMPTPPVPDNVPLEPLGATVPVTPEKQIRKGRSQRIAVKEPSMESIKVYSPPSMIGTPQSKPTPVRPIRNMTSQWRGNESMDKKLSPFRTPDKDEFHPEHPATTTNHRADILSPARYNAEDNRGRLREEVSDFSNASRPTTTFTDMLGAIGFPDPGPAPAMPEVPRALNMKKGKRI
jgi:hypothetical protein